MIPEIHGLKYTDSDNFFLIAGPCVVESKEILDEVAGHLSMVSEKHSIPLIFKSSFRKANRSKADSYSGPGDIEGLEKLAETAKRYKLPALTDIHNPDEAALAARYVDVLQIPAFLCRQTDLLSAAAKTGKWVNIKKGQFLSGDSMKFAAEKVFKAGNDNIMLTERGNTFGYTDLVVDMRNIPAMKNTGYPVITDVTHSLQQPNQSAGVTGGRPDLIETIARAAIAAGTDGIFIETHPDPSKALSDGANMLKLDLIDDLIYGLKEIKQTINNLKNKRK